jgi:transposase
MPPRERHWWTEPRRTAFELIDSGKTQKQAAAQVGVSQRVVEGWARRPAWRALLAEREAKMHEALAAADREWRDWLAEHSAERKTMMTEAVERYKQSRW